MAEIERMAALCMKDLDDDEAGDEDLDDEDLLVANIHTCTSTDFHFCKLFVDSSADCS